ncbi:hypothetical protein EBR21_12835 [bacterium]|nr:hypothetical protein [bacterium]
MDGAVNTGGFEDDSILPPQSQEEYRHLVGLVSSIADFPRMQHKEQNHLIRELESYECYRQVDQLLRWRLGSPSETRQQLMQDYVWLMKVLYLGLDSFESFVEVAKMYIRHLQVPFSTIRLHILDEILGPENFKEHAIVLREVFDEIQEVSQKVLLLERLALIYEKKLFLESEYEPIYHRILTLEKTNEKARKFFKLIHIHNMEWAEAAEQLKVLAQHAESGQERARYSHELAQLYLYNLNQPGGALELLRPLALEHPEIRHTLIEAFERLDLVDELLSSLLTFERSSRDVEESSQFKFRRGCVLLKVGRTEEAVKALRESLQLQPGSLLIHESLVSALVELGSLGELSDQLSRLREVVNLDSSRSTLDDLIRRSRQLAQVHGASLS